MIHEKEIVVETKLSKHEAWGLQLLDIAKQDCFSLQLLTIFVVWIHDPYQLKQFEDSMIFVSCFQMLPWLSASYSCSLYHGKLLLMLDISSLKGSRRSSLFQAHPGQFSWSLHSSCCNGGDLASFVFHMPITFSQRAWLEHPRMCQLGWSQHTPSSWWYTYKWSDLNPPLSLSCAFSINLCKLG